MAERSVGEALLSVTVELFNLIVLAPVTTDEIVPAVIAYPCVLKVPLKKPRVFEPIFNASAS